MNDTPYPVELEAVDIGPYKNGNTGIDYVTTFDSGEPGPHVMVNAVVHGNELCGAITLDFLFRNEVRPMRGKLTLSFANHEAYNRFNPADPGASRYVDEDFNRLWTADVLDGERDTAELRRARQFRPAVDAADYLLDIHSMQHRTPPIMICGPLEKGRQLARDIGAPVHVVSDEGHAAGKRMRDYAGFGDPESPKNALLVECGQHWEKSSADVAKDVTLRFLRHYHVIDPGFAVDHLSPEPLEPQKMIEVSEPVTIKTDEFRFADDYIGLEVIAEAGTVIGWDGDEEIRTPYDDCVLVMPSRRLRKGESAVRLGRQIG